ncbi:hypothetical protein BCR24_06655 [Enterococcus ureilyticus]|uniref:Integrase n=1 Tax=Enterococcus ureilyticus TaxID=1131292 RepID=A0A1E5H9C3_9ENTE|nr:site-specific integrase [Enterococcus ureilyticus]MBM7688449.1 integrase [Enterococcus ureilyticus]OEG21548.1 hypothetical protein BCR24_06655 [Enterococcus ureilyticus]
MAKIQNVYRDKKTKKWFYKKRLPKNNPLGKEWAIKKGFETASEAKEMLNIFLNDLEKRTIEDQDTDGVEFMEFFESVAVPHFERSLKASTYRNRMFVYRYYFPYFNGLKITDIQKRDIAIFKDHLQSRTNIDGEILSSHYINNILIGINQVLDLALEREIVSENVGRNVKRVKERTKREISYWTLEEFDMFFDSISKYRYIDIMKRAGFYTLFFSGLRVGELMARKWTDIDWEKGSIYINSTLDYRNKIDWSASPMDGAKTFGSKGWVKLSPKNLELLKKWKGQQQLVGDMEYIFMYDGSMYAIRNWKLWQDQIIDKYNVGKEKGDQLRKIRTHDFRDSHAMWLLSMGVDIKTIQKRLRHENAKTTMSYYLDKIQENETNVLELY